MARRACRPIDQEDAAARSPLEPGPEGEPGAARGLAFSAFILLLLSLWLPWWLVRYENDVGVRYEAVATRLFAGKAPYAYNSATVVTGLLVVALAVWLFLRLAGRSWSHEPRVWRRDLWLQAGGTALALASTLFWPKDVPHFWGGRSFAVGEPAVRFSEDALPALGWWSAALAAILLLVAAWRAHVVAKAAGGDEAEPTSDK